MNRFEYRVQKITTHLPVLGAGQLSDHLNQYAADGWRVLSVSTIDGSSHAQAPATVLLEREINPMDSFRRLFAPGA